MNRLAKFIADGGMDLMASMNAAQSVGLISDNVIHVDEVPDCDAERVIHWFLTGEKKCN